ncbi:MAG: RNA polymerase sporulation sigma factor SigH [Armatimonadetes bacterium]|nr:RNA polymerase sporulation sigma factor SigH [Armatimonadota bacterium]
MKTRALTIGFCYDRLPDQAIVEIAQDGDIRAAEYMLYKYRSLVRTKTRSYFLMGAEKEDLLQVGMIGLWQSIMDYSPDKEISFLSFARICIERHVITAIKTATRQKQFPLNSAISLDYCVEEADSDFNLEEILVSDMDLDPEEMLLRREDARNLQASLRLLLSDFEWGVLKLYHFGKSYKEIADDLGCNTKSVDNALGRIKRKVMASPGAVIQ